MPHQRRIPPGDQSLASDRRSPRLTPSKQPGVKGHIEFHNPGLESIKRELRVIEGLLSVYGLSFIEMESPEETWEAETEEEREQLQIYSFVARRERVPISELAPVPFNLLARSFISAPRAGSMETALSFHRKGQNDFSERRYIEAIYDFYFMLESLFGNGKTKNYEVKAELRKTQELRKAISDVLADAQAFSALDRSADLRAVFERRYRNKTVDEIIGDIVELRGFLHHHATNRPDIWSPHDENRFECDAMFLAIVTHHVAFNIAGAYVFSSDVLKQYQNLYTGVSELTGKEGSLK